MKRIWLDLFIHVQVIAPLKNITISRLELLACSIEIRLGETVFSDIKVPDRVSMGPINYSFILDTERCQVGFAHIIGNLNPEDIPSKGCSVELLLQSKWQEGPSGLHESCTRCMVWILRILYIMKAKDENIRTADLTCSEIERAERKLVLVVHEDSFGKYSEEKIRVLRPAVDDKGIIRLKTKVILVYRQVMMNF
ncbi:hypothetical protein NPIL_673841 [Nephila pilipes]|uniref:Uncharacterized protein n=1 Tax=Nephila pilipes TaxID=299642 RepID=A0A8X6QNZ6_NEPPI|nr:hypothetical protein NPIL_351061 [Nephila pilipes]GFT92808.1 hypothetical protein NPIL_656431 [Nephila pilipes]GFU03093.1 hypothetical protein NPIL_77081 [Nephila pilipes]GFU35234.1 hypothetical protein NPIL_673841 [Nephila pilipes]